MVGLGCSLFCFIAIGFIALLGFFCAWRSPGTYLSWRGGFIMRALGFCGQFAMMLFFLLISTFSFGYSGGDGSLATPWEISSVDSLLELAGDTANYDKYFVLTSDIDLAGIGDLDGAFSGALIAPDCNDVSYGYQGEAFSGVFDGGGHKISNLTIIAQKDEIHNVGFFGKIENAVVKGLILQDVTVFGGSTSKYVGGLAGVCSGVISDCQVIGSIYGNAGVGAVFGSYKDIEGGSMVNCSSSGTVSGYVAVGGLVGINDGGSITDCHSLSIVVGEMNSQCLGGFVGKNEKGEISACHAIGSVSGGDNVGGLVGWNRQGALKGCYAMGEVNGHESVGGLAGLNYDTIGCSYATGSVTGDVFVGGIVGSNITGSSISRCYATGDITGNLHIAGLVGLTSPGACISDSFWDRDTTGMFFGYNISSSNIGSIVNVRSMTTKMLQSQVLLDDAGWKFQPFDKSEFCWRTRSDIKDYPRLSWQFPKSDVNGDMKVDWLDFSTLAANWLMNTKSEGFSPFYDLDNTGSSYGLVDLADFNSLIKDGVPF